MNAGIKGLLRTAAVLIAISPVAGAAEIQVFAAASLTDAITEISKMYEKQTGVVVHCAFDGSSRLARQIASGAPADVFVSADMQTMDALARNNLILRDTRIELLTNTLCLVVANDVKGPIREPRDLLEPTVRRLAVADPEAVPAGIYTREYLQRLGIWDALRPKVIPVENVRAALAAVDSGNAEGAFVYVTDARMARRSRVAFSVGGPAAPRITYPAAVLASSGQTDAARSYLAFLESPQARHIFGTYGFGVK